MCVCEEIAVELNSDVWFHVVPSHVFLCAFHVMVRREKLCCASLLHLLLCSCVQDT